MIDRRHAQTWGPAVKVFAVEVVTLLALFALQQAFTR
jgi:hypothetical protein